MKRMCRKAFDTVYIAANGNVRICAWNDVVIGNLLENNLYEIWHGEEADKIRKDFMDGNLRLCREHHCPCCIQGQDYIFFNNDEEAQQVYDNLPEFPLEFCIGYDLRCNHVCPSCRAEAFVPDENYIDNIKTITKNIEPYLKNARMIDINGGGEIFICHELLDMLSRFNPVNKNCTVYFETNGVLFKRNWKKIEHLSNNNLIISVTPNSFDRETYRYLAGKDDLDAFNESFDYMKELRSENKIKHLRVTMVVQDSNFRQIPEFIQNCLDHNADDIVLRPIFKWFCISEEDWFFKNIQNPAHPYHKEYMEVLNNPICKHEKVFDWGISEKQKPITFQEFYAAPNIYDHKYVKNRKKAIIEKIGNDEVVVYGIGNIGKILVEELTSGNKIANIKCIAITNAKQKEYYLGNEIKQINGNLFDESTKCIIATNRKDFIIQMIAECRKMGVKEGNIIRIDELYECCD